MSTTQMSTTTTDPRLIRLAAGDNVLILATTVPAGTVVEVGGNGVALERDLTLGHKIAARDIAAGETILKYAFPIGIATQAIAAGAHVHVQNVRSNYTASYVVEAE